MVVIMRNRCASESKVSELMQGRPAASV